MVLVHASQLLPIGFLCACLAAQDPESFSAKNPTDQNAEAVTSKVDGLASAKALASCEQRECEDRNGCCHPKGLRRPATFQAFVQTLVPLHDLGEDLGKRTGYGLGVQWTRDHDDRHASRTRLEWNTFPEGALVQGIRTTAKNSGLSMDHLFKLNHEGWQAYLVAGLGGSRWCLEQTTAGIRDTRWTTKLAITGGIGIRVADRVSVEVRYVVSSIDRAFDANTMQVSLAWALNSHARFSSR